MAYPVHRDKAVITQLVFLTAAFLFCLNSRYDYNSTYCSILVFLKTCHIDNDDRRSKSNFRVTGKKQRAGPMQRYAPGRLPNAQRTGCPVVLVTHPLFPAESYYAKAALKNGIRSNAMDDDAVSCSTSQTSGTVRSQELSDL